MENNIEKEINEVFEQYHPDMNTDELWGAIEPKLKKKKKKRFLIFWLLGGGLLLLSSLLYNSIDSNSFSKISDSTEEEEKHSADKAISNFNEHQEIRKHKEEGTVSVVNSDQTKNLSPKITAEIVTIDYALNEKRTGASIEKTDRGESPDLEMATTTNKPISKVLAEGEVKNSMVRSQLNKGSVDTSLEVINELVQDENLVYEIKNNNSITEGLIEEAAIEKQRVEKLGKEKTKSKKKKKNKKKRRKKLVKPVRKSAWEVELQTSGAPILAFKSLKNNQGADVANLAHLNKRKESEKQLEGFGYNVGVVFHHKKTGLTLLSSLEYRQFNERFEYFSTEVTTDLETGAITITEDSKGNVINSTTGPKLVTTTKTEEQKLYNQHRFISIPIGIGKTWQNRKSEWRLMGGVEYNLLYTFEGTMWVSMQEKIAFQKDKNREYYNSIFKSSTDFGLWFSGGYSRAINPRLSWLFAPKIQIPLTSTTKDDYAIKQNFFALQFDFGISYLLNPKRKNKKAAKKN